MTRYASRSSSTTRTSNPSRTTSVILTSNPRSPASPSSISWGRYVLPSNEVVGPRKPWTNSLRRVVLKAEPDVAVSRPSNVVGFTIGCSINGLQFDSGLLDPNYAVLDALGAALFRHPVGQTDVAFLKDHNLAWSVGATFEDTTAALRLVYADVPRRFPRMRVIVLHLGGTLPFLVDRLTRKGGAATIEVSGRSTTTRSRGPSTSSTARVTPSAPTDCFSAPTTRSVTRGSSNAT